MNARFAPSPLALALLLTCTPTLLLAQPGQPDADLEAQDTEAQALQLPEAKVLGTAEEALKQAPGVSIINAEDISRRPPSNDLSDIIRREPGVNLTGNSASGSRGNNRQIDLRGMGPENTLILIDGRPSTSRNAVRYGWSGDRDTRGETNWVPAEQVERIEILRGPAAARYGSGAMGGVVNIITKRPTEELHGSATFYTVQPEDDAEGAGQRTNFSLSGPLAEALTWRVYGGLNKTEADDLDINAASQVDSEARVAGREGVRNKDLAGLLSWRIDPQQVLDLDLSYSRQGNIYAGDTMLNGGGEFIDDLYGQETNVIQRSSFALTHRGDFDWGSSQASLGYDYNRNERLNEGLAGGGEGAPTEGAGRFTSRLRNTRASAEVNLPLSLGAEQVLTLGGEYLYESLNDPGSTRAQSWDPGVGGVPPLAGFNRGTSKTTADSYALYVEDNIEVGTGTTLTPGLRYDDHEVFGDNWSPSLNASHELTEALTLKGGIARAYKTPNLYQSNPGYLLFSRGNGCNANEANNGGCYLVGSADLEPETSINKEIGLSFDQDNWRTSATYFRNDYRNKIVASNLANARLADGRRVLQWTNAGKAVVEGVEGNLFVRLSDQLDWNTNFTYMLESEDRETGEPLSVVPEYTVNSRLDWQASERLSFELGATHYGTQEAPSRNLRTDKPYAADAQRDIDPYTLVDLSGGFAFSEHLSVRVGIKNLFDKQLYREGNADEAGAASYNEPGRAYFASLTTSF
ncbi:MAG: FepA family TonB-dependent siderophore receptor [Pseudomonas sp.]|uniref:FepA family TonB-dependent siderophore receptor n=1 Tax=Pseudomonas sp. TaxID=306 RepID=UPI00339337F4